MNTALFTTTDGYNRSEIMKRAHRIRRAWAASPAGAKPTDMANALKKAWIAARSAKSNAIIVARINAETADQTAARHAELALQVARSHRSVDAWKIAA